MQGSHQSQPALSLAQGDHSTTAVQLLASGKSEAPSETAMHLVLVDHVHGGAVLRLLVGAVLLVRHVRRRTSVHDLRFHLLCIRACPAPECRPLVSCVVLCANTEAEATARLRSALLACTPASWCFLQVSKTTCAQDGGSG